MHDYWIQVQLYPYSAHIFRLHSRVHPHKFKVFMPTKRKRINIRNLISTYTKDRRVRCVCDSNTGSELTLTALAGLHHKPLGQHSKIWAGEDSNLRCFCVPDLQSGAFATRLPTLNRWSIRDSNS